MKSFFYKLIGIALIFAAIVGLIFSIGISVLMWQYKDTAVTGISSSIDLIITALEATGEGLEISQQALETSVKSIKALSGTVEATARSIESTGPLLNSLSTLLNEDIPTTIGATQSSLTTVAESAKILDGFLGLITSLPLINRYDYNPEVPLHAALSDVSESLEGIPDALSEMESGLKTSGDNVQVINAELQLMVDSINEIEGTVEGFSNVVSQYQSLIDDVHSQLSTLQENLPTIFTYLFIALTIFLAWMAIAQLGLLTQGWELLHRNGDDDPVEASTSEPPESEEVQA